MAIRRGRLLRYIAVTTFILTVFFLLRGTRPGLFDDPDIRSRYASLRAKIHFVPGSFDWSNATQFYPVSSHAHLPQGQPKKLPRVQHDFTNSKHGGVTDLSERRRKAVRQVFLRGWDAYKEQAWGWDELKPVSGGGRTTFGGWAATLVDALDTLWIMGLHPQFYEAVAYAVALDFSNTTETSANMFETTIRYLGGLLAAYDLSGEPALLAKAKELGEFLYMGFDTPNRMPGFWLNFEDAKAGRQRAGVRDPSACPASLSLEFTRLAQLTGDHRYYDAIERIRVVLERTQGESKLPGMWPTAIDWQNEKVTSDNSFTLGALADSLYEYLPKMYILTGGLERSYEKMYREAMDVVVKHILFRPMLPDRANILFPGNAYANAESVDLTPEGQHLSCFVGGMFLLGGRTFDIDGHIGIGERVTRGCTWAYDAMPTGLMPEIFNMIPCPTLAGCEWDEERWEREANKKLKKGFKNARDPRYILRPEAIESVFILYRVTGNEELRDIAWRMFESIDKATRTPIANSAISDVTVKGETEKLDSMEVSIPSRASMTISKLDSNNFPLPELLAGRDPEVFLFDILGSQGRRQPRRLGIQHRGSPPETSEMISRVKQNDCNATQGMLKQMLPRAACTQKKQKPCLDADGRCVRCCVSACSIVPPTRGLNYGQPCQLIWARHLPVVPAPHSKERQRRADDLLRHLPKSVFLPLIIHKKSPRLV